VTSLHSRKELQLGWSEDAWASRLEADARAVDRLLPSRLRPLHDLVVSRAREVDANALILSGSTARGRRTEISDLDYHLVGPKIVTTDLAHELDLHVLSAEKLGTEILAGDDFVQWSLRFGCVVFDDGTLRQALRLIGERRPWPDVVRKREHAGKSIELARRVVETGDEDGALVQVRTALSLAARAFLLSRRIFPMSRAELPRQLSDAGYPKAGEALDSTIEREPGLSELAAATDTGRGLLALVDDGVVVSSS
jgi:hypothetical protein